ncbi:MAG: orotidine 5'-phosphate decarboxylase / HUMPS family protein [Propionicimonas sp.]|nr:orotidine 5'-phosphate decarboxylase / HUMPS family protein [Propionicimonas sp.]
MGAQLQLALDAVGYDQAMGLVAEVEPHIDILELGTPFLFLNGLDALRQFGERFPRLAVLSDCKIMDGGGPMAEYSLVRGARYVTVLAVADDQVLADAQEAASVAGAAVVADLIACPDPVKRAQELHQLGVDHLCVHGGYGGDLDRTLASAERRRAEGPGCWLSVAGGISLGVVDRFAALRPDALVIGSAITAATDPGRAAAEFRAAVNGGAW